MNKILSLIKQEERRQAETLMMIPSENYASKEVRTAVGSVFSNKYSEGYPGKRYYQGNKVVDEVENFAIEQAKKLFKVPHANVQPYSGSPANSAVLFALIESGEKIMGMKLAAGGHLTHGQPKITFSGRYFQSVQFGVDKNGLLDYEAIAKLAKEEKPKVMIIGTTAYPLAFDWKRFGQIADSVGSWLVADIAHVAGLIIAQTYPSPVDHAHIITTTTHKTLRGPRGAMIMATKKGLEKDSELGVKIDRAVFPGFQGGPHNNTTAGIAQALIEAGETSFKKYGQKIVKNAKTLAKELKKGGMTLVGGGTECHLLLVDLRPLNLSGNVIAEGLEVAGIIVNRNSVPNDKMPPFYPSGIRLGTPGLTTRGMGEVEMKKIADWILLVINHLKDYKLPKEPKERARFIKEYKKEIVDDEVLISVAKKVKELCKKFPIP